MNWQPIDYDSIADLYDVYVTVEYDIPFILSEASKAAGPVLELTSGTGRVSIPLIESGVRLTCVDRAGRMLDILRHKLAMRGLAAEVLAMDICSLEFQARFDLVILPMNALMEVVGQQRRRALLSGVFAALRSGGRFICTFHNPRVRRLQVDGIVRRLGAFPLESGTMVVSGSEQGGDPVITRLQYFEIFDDTGLLRSKQLLRMEFELIEKEPFESAARDAGFRIAEFYGDYDRSPYDPVSSPTMIWILEKRV